MHGHVRDAGLPCASPFACARTHPRAGSASGHACEARNASHGTPVYPPTAIFTCENNSMCVPAALWHPGHASPAVSRHQRRAGGRSGHSGAPCVPARRFRASGGPRPVTPRRSGTLGLPARGLLTRTCAPAVTFRRSGTRGAPARGLLTTGGGPVVTFRRTGSSWVPAHQLLTTTCGPMVTSGRSGTRGAPARGLLTTGPLPCDHLLEPSWISVGKIRIPVVLGS